MTAEVTRYGGLDMQVCVPDEWDNEYVLKFAERAYACGTTSGWQIRRAGSCALKGDPERQPCVDRGGHVHIMLDA